MIYKGFKDKQLSTLGLGNMRLPTKNDGHGPVIDEERAAELIEYAYEHGVNYFDTAYGYHNGRSEIIVGKVLGKYPRDSWYLATKFPGHMMKYTDGGFEFMGYMVGSTITDISEIFEEQLKKCGVEYFDFYLLHNLCETAFDFYTNEELGVVRYLLEQKAKGRIKHLGFSAHGRADTIEKFLNIYPDIFEFGQIQLNYLDWILQDAGRKYEVLTRYNIPVITMESCRGGSLVHLPENAAQLLKQARLDDSIVSWAFRYLQSLPNVQVVLSGMSDMDQLKENIAVFDTVDPLTEDERAILDKVTATMTSLVPCTACRYCCDNCPSDLDIPKLISMYNEMSNNEATGIKFSTLSFTLGAMKDCERPGACVACGACSAVCPQGINIPDVMSKFDKLLSK